MQSVGIRVRTLTDMHEVQLESPIYTMLFIGPTIKVS